jgi:hypothetical protein
MTAILAHFRSLECRHRHKKPKLRRSPDCDAVRQGNLHCSATGTLGLCPISDRKNDSGDHCLKSGTERANKILFTDVMRKNKFRHALEQVPFQIANTSRCAMMAPLRCA